MRVRVLYFASLRDAAGCASETVESDSLRLSDLYDRQRATHGFALPRETLRVAVNGAFAGWGDIAADGDDVAFIPPVSGG
jgi:sulfur-carrier protein